MVDIIIADFLMFLFAVYLGTLMFNLLNPKFRIAEYENGKFYIERKSELIPFFWHRNIMSCYGGNIKWKDVLSSTMANGYQSADAARERLSMYYKYVDGKKHRSKRKRVVIVNEPNNYDQKRVSEIIELLKTAEKDQIDSLLVELKEVNEIKNYEQQRNV